MIPSPTVNYSHIERPNDLIAYLNGVDDFASENHSLMLIVIKNYEQIKSLLSIEEITAYNHIINTSIAELCENNIPGAKIFNHAKYYYCLVPKSDQGLIEQLAHQIHKKLFSENFKTIFADLVFVALPLIHNLKFNEYLNLLSDQVYYLQSNKIFNWIEDGASKLEQIVSSYHFIDEIRKAIHNKTICFAFQPIVDCKTGEVVHHECLLRLSDADYHLISAGKYILLAEKYGFVSIIDEAVIEMVTEELVNSNAVSLSINLSSISVQSPILLTKLQELLTKHQIGPRLIIEITETAINNNFTQTKVFIETVKKFGCKIALDDFGTGYTSFNQLKNLAIDIIKIDGSYIKDLAISRRNQFIVETLIRMADELGSKTVAEYVESAEVAAILADMKVDCMQGNFFSPATINRSWKRF